MEPRERAIIAARVPEIDEHLAIQIAQVVRSVRNVEVKKAPSISETIDWARTLLLLGVREVDSEVAKSTLHVLLKYRSDIDKVAKELSN